jgi:hypothetical protein
VCDSIVVLQLEGSNHFRRGRRKLFSAALNSRASTQFRPMELGAAHALLRRILENPEGDVIELVQQCVLLGPTLNPTYTAQDGRGVDHVYRIWNRCFACERSLPQVDSPIHAWLVGRSNPREISCGKSRSAFTSAS